MSAAPTDEYEHPMLAALSHARGSVKEMAGQPLWTMLDADLVQAVTCAVALVAQAQALLVHVVGEVDSRGAATATGAPTTTSWLRARHKLHPADAARVVRTAQAFRGALDAYPGGLPATQAALSDGQITLTHAHGVVRACAELPSELHPAVADVAEKLLVQDARENDPVIAARMAASILGRVDPDGQDARDGERLAKAEKKAAKRNQLTFAPDGTGGIFIRGRLDAEAHAIVDAALQPLMAPRGDTAEGPDLRTIDTRRADALVELCRRMLAAGELPTHGGMKPQVVVLLPYKTLTDGIGVGVLPTGEPISPVAARHWACDAGIVAAVLDGNSRPLDVTDEKRLFEGRLRRALELRDGGCAFPGCGRPIAWTEAHHIVPWSDGGTTCLANGVLLCRSDHRLVEQGDWEVFIHSDGFPAWRPPPWIDPERKLLRNHLHRPEQPRLE